ncbi:Rid family hydrolase [Nonomuraea sp. NBC_01738]|nr:Rid family hydrolase [Nonomuraea sp. NBC_01738]
MQSSRWWNVAEPSSIRDVITFLGQGRMGVPMARRLVEAGHEVTVWRRGTGVSPAEAVGGARIVITMLRDGAAAREVMTAALPGLRPDATVIEMSTIGPAAVAELRALLPASVRLIDAPVLGSVPPATDGTLTILTGGDVSGCKDVLEVFGTVREAGPLGAGAALKLAVMSAIVPAQVLVAETFAYGEAHGVSRTALAEVLAGTPLAGVAARVREAAPETRYSLSLAAKDLSLAAWNDSTVAAAACLRLQEAEAAGLGDHDLTAITDHVRRPRTGTNRGTQASADPTTTSSGTPPLEHVSIAGDRGPAGGQMNVSFADTNSPAGRVVAINPATVPATNGYYSHATRVGDMLYVSGQAAFDETGQVVAPGDMTAQAEYVFRNVETILADQGASFEDVAFVRTYLVDMDQRVELGAVRSKYFTGAPPASTTVEVSRLFMPGLAMEMDLIVALPRAEGAGD